MSGRAAIASKSGARYGVGSGETTVTLNSRAMRVAVVFGTYPPERNGGADFVARFAAALAEREAEVHVLTSVGHGPEREEVVEGVTVHRTVEEWTLSEDGRGTLRKVNELLRSEGVDVVHVLFPDSVLQGRYQLPAAIGLRRLPLVTTFWNLGLGRRSPMSIRLEALALLGRSSVLSSHDPGYLAAMERLAGRTKPVRWLPVGTNIAAEARRAPSAVRRELGLRNTPLLGYFGQLDFTRGVEDLLEAVAQMRGSGSDARLVMIGAADSARYELYEAQAERLGLNAAVRWTPWLGPGEAAELLASLDLCVLPYRRNSLGRSALAAALTLGVPTVLAGTPKGIAPLMDGRDVELVAPGDPAGLAHTLQRLLDDEAARMRLREGARVAARHFAWPRIAEAARGIYSEAIRRFRKSR
jgi:glycosyltransferase involved in cell wall biosynthesis